MFAVSIITVCKNAQDTIEKTIQSVLGQTYKNIEYIIIDGLSTDATLERIKKYKNKISKIISEPDNGIYDAMNKGIALAKGDLYNFLNAGDLLYEPNTIERVVEEFNKTGALVLNGKSIYENIPAGLEKRIAQRSFILKSKIDVAKGNIPQQCIFYTKEAFEKFGIFDTRFRYCADMEWFLRFLNSRFQSHYVDLNICIYNFDGVSTTKPHVLEIIAAFQKNMNFFEFFHYLSFATARQCLRFLKGERLY